MLPQATYIVDLSPYGSAVVTCKRRVELINFYFLTVIFGNTMDYSKFYNIRDDGTYRVHFANKKGLSKENIMEVFSLYGTVLSIDAKGDQYGLRFVRYKTLQETVNCLKGLQDNQQIRLLPEKFKNNANNSKESSRNLAQQEILQDSCNRKNKEKQSNLNMIRNSHLFSTNTNVIEDDKVSETTKSRYSWCNSESGFIRSNKSNKEDRITRLIKLQELRGVTADSFGPPVEADKFQDCKEIINNHVSNLKNISVSSTCSSASSLERVVLPVFEVIVANVHSDFGVHYVMYLLEEYDPISVSLMQTIPETKIRYCRVYFKSGQEAVDARQKFDNFNLAGRKLIVSTPTRLMEEALSA
ncbi:hypothetical protein KM043_004679 [Ampulex compressa]|nr:hypothetical protein KM043_004679 [Ampulex compressa]